MTEVEETESTQSRHNVAKPKSSQKSQKDENVDEISSNLSNYSFDLTKEEIEKIKRDYDRDPDRIADDITLFKDLALEEMKNKGHEVKIKETSQSHELNAENLAEICSFFKE